MTEQKCETCEVTPHWVSDQRCLVCPTNPYSTVVVDAHTRRKRDEYWLGRLKAEMVFNRVPADYHEWYCISKENFDALLAELEGK